jgi:acetate kinase
VDRRLILVVNAGSETLKLSLVGDDDRSQAVGSLADVEPDTVTAVGHRVVHGGARFLDPVVLDEAIEEEIRALATIAPLHNRPALEGIREARRRFPGAPQIGVFDTSFHATLPEAAATYALPLRWRDEWGIRRYGFHGISVQWSSERATALLGHPPARLVVCHVGGGCSITAVREGRSVDTTMGFSPLEGVAMATRSGSVDPGALLYLLSQRGLSVSELDHVLVHESGLKGLSGGSGSVQALVDAERDGDVRARLALAVYVRRIAGAVASMAASLGGIDAVVFTAGVGESSAPVRARVCARLAFLGIRLDAGANESAHTDTDVAAADSAVRVLVIRAREEIVIARAVRALVGGSERPRGQER